MKRSKILHQYQNVIIMAMMNPFPFANPDEIRYEPMVYGKSFKNEYHVNNLPSLGDRARGHVSKAKKYALEQSIQFHVAKKSQQTNVTEASALRRIQAITLVSRIYIGSIFFEVGEPELRKAFEQFGPIRSVVLSHEPLTGKHKGYAFMEFERPEGAILALENMNGYMIGGRGIKVGRPSNSPPTGEYEEELRSDFKNRKRLYICGVHSGLNESEIQTVFEAFGPLKSCRLVMDPLNPGTHRGHGYVEFEDEPSSVVALQGMIGGMVLAGQRLRCTRAMVPFDFQPPTSAASVSAATSAASKAQKAVAMAAAVGEVTLLSDNAESAVNLVLNPPKLPEEELQYLQPPVNALPLGLSKFSNETATDLPPPGIFIPPTTNIEGLQEANEPIDDSTSHLTEEQFLEALETSCVLLLENLIDTSDVDEELEADVAEECSKFGDVIRVIVHVRSEDVRVFVQYDSTEGARAGLAAMDKRFFAGRQVSAWLYPNERYQMRQLNDPVLFN
ncbi:Poly(U)-binding-splicing factor puf60 [Cichlidogyrus casuarinus]|uniref:Poly(U)-binding-splicing factor puf60 n=1 Tax=Cichlidogyrus casuarinus TaxID=1844966 RepID=A0ABD2QMB1_9PLAT